jgi:hypothetical protein
MDKKAKADHTPNQPPLDDERWMSIEAAHQRGVERTGDNDLAVIDLEKLLADDRLPCMRRSTASGERQRVAAIAWTDLIRLYSGKEVSVIYRASLHRSPGGSYVVDQVRGWRFYIWQPDLDRIWPPPGGTAPVEHHDDSDMKEPVRAIDRAKAVLRHLYPTKAQMPGVLKEATRKVVAECEKRDWKPPSEDRVQRAAEELGYRPPRKRK